MFTVEIGAQGYSTPMDTLHPWWCTMGRCKPSKVIVIEEELELSWWWWWRVEEDNTWKRNVVGGNVWCWWGH